MFVTNVGNQEELVSIVVKLLRELGIKHRFKKNILNVTKHFGVSRTGSLFNRSLHQLPTITTMINGEAAIEIPIFLLDACSCLRQNIDTEGIFRKGGSAARQKEIKASLDLGRRLGQHHEIDVASVLKHFLRELPEPLIPYSFHEIFLRCLLLKEKKVEGLLLTCLLLPVLNINTLAYLMGFLLEVASHSDANKMDITNLAIVISPSVMPIGEKMTVNSGSRLNNHVQIVELLIRNAAKIGTVPESLIEKVSNSSVHISSNLEENSEDVLKHGKRKKRRSASLTRMINGFKKMVGKTTESEDSSDCLTPVTNLATPNVKSGAKRKGFHSSATSAFSSKKKRDKLKSLQKGLSLMSTPQTPFCTENCYHHTPSVCAHPDPRKISPVSKSNHRRFFTSPKADKVEDVHDDTEKKSRLSFRGRRRVKKQTHGEVASKQDISDTSGFSNNLSEAEYKWNSGVWGRIKPESKTSLQVCKLSPELQEELPSEDNVKSFPFIQGSGVNLSDDDTASNIKNETDTDQFVRIPKSEYEAIKNRVSAIECRISKEFGNIVGENSDGRVSDSCEENSGNASLVQSAYEKTLEVSSNLDSSCTDQLAKRLSRDLKIRRSLESKVIRSPSARKIGSIRRRSKERSSTLLRTLSWQLPSKPDTSHLLRGSQSSQRLGLKRGRPNTVYTGLPQPSSVHNMNSSVTSKEDSRIRLVFQNEPSDESQAADMSGLCASLEPLQFLPFYHRLSDGPTTRSQVQHHSSFNGLNNTTNSSHLDTKGIKNINKNYIPSPKSSGKNEEEKWQNAESFFNTKSYLQDKVANTGRASIVKLLNENAGMVSERLKLFNSKGNCDVTDASQTASSDVSKLQQPGARNDRKRVLLAHSSKNTPSRNMQFNRKHSIRLSKTSAIGSSPSSQMKSTPKNSPKKIGSPRKHLCLHSPYSLQKSKLDKSVEVKTKLQNVRPKEKRILKHSSLRSPRSVEVPGSHKKNVTLPSNWSDSSKENVLSPEENGRQYLSSSHEVVPKVIFPPQLSLPDNLKETIYDVCTPLMDKFLQKAATSVEKHHRTSMSPLKDCNRSIQTPREMPRIKQTLMTISPRQRQYARTPLKMAVDGSVKRLNTPLKATPLKALLVSSTGSPVQSPRRQSPRLLHMKARNITKMY